MTLIWRTCRFCSMRNACRSLWTCARSRDARQRAPIRRQARILRNPVYIALCSKSAKALTFENFIFVPPPPPPVDLSAVRGRPPACASASDEL